MERVVTADQAGAALSTLLKQVARGDEVVITARGRRRAVLLSYDQLRTLQAVARLIREPAAQSALKRSDDDVRAGRVFTLKGKPSIRRILSASRSRKQARAVG